VTRAPERIETERLLLRRPARNDVLGIFARYASDLEVTRYLSWPRHRTVDDTLMFIDFSDSEWLRDGCGPYLVISRLTGTVLGSTGLSLDTPHIAQTGYVFARDAWGRGYATESLTAMVGLARAQALTRLYALCHADHHASAHVLEKCGFTLEARRHKSQVFPNLTPEKQDVLSYAIELSASQAVTPPMT
jgi:[ribosomal protein S5]-alanine N-acetyltransferase